MDSLSRREKDVLQELYVRGPLRLNDLFVTRRLLRLSEKVLIQSLDALREKGYVTYRQEWGNYAITAEGEEAALPISEARWIEDAVEKVSYENWKSGGSY